MRAILKFETVKDHEIMDLCIYNLNIEKIQQQKLDQVEVLSAHIQDIVYRIVYYDLTYF